jgi:putative hydrolase of the HAD superfamily
MTMHNKTMSKYVTPLLPIPTSVKPSLTLKKPVHAVLFDIYGTLFVSKSGDIGLSQKETDRMPLLETLLAKYNINQTVQSVTKRLHSAIEDAHKDMQETGIKFPEIRIDQIWMDIFKFKDILAAQYFAVEYEMITNPVYPMPGLNDMIDILFNRGVYMGIISNAQFYTPHVFDMFCGELPENLGFHPDLLFYSFEHNQAKPSLYLFEKALSQIKKIGIIPQEVLYVGNDMLNDIYPAHTIGFQTCLFAGDERSLRLREGHPKCSELSPDAIVTDLNQLSKIV